MYGSIPDQVLLGTLLLTFHLETTDQLPVSRPAPIASAPPKTCIHCGAQNNASAFICTNCGKSIG